LNFQEMIENVIFKKCQLDDLSALCINILAYVVVSDTTESSFKVLKDEIKSSFRDKNIHRIKISVVPVQTLSTKKEFLHVLMECFQ